MELDKSCNVKIY